MAWEFKCVCGAKYEAGQVPETCGCGNNIAEAQAYGHRVWQNEGPTSFRCTCGGVIESTSFGWTGQQTMFECSKCGQWSYRLWDIAFDEKSFIEELELRARDAANRTAQGWVHMYIRGVKASYHPISSDGRTFQVRGGWYPTPAMLPRVAQEYDTVAAVSDFIKTGIGKRHWGYEESVGLLGVFETLLEKINSGCIDHQRGVQLCRQLAKAVEAEFVYAAR